VFWRPTIQALEGHSRHAPAFAYRYDFAPRALRLNGLGATHASELFAVFGAANTGLGRALTSLGSRRDLLAVTKQMQEHWLSFARTGHPLVSWPQYSEQRRSTMVFDRRPRVLIDPDRDRRIAWQGVGVPSLLAASARP
jgi:para-nitrobenzyl esterase